MNSKYLTSTSLIAGILLSTQAWSVSLTSAGDYAISGTTFAARPELGGTVIADTLSNFSFSGAGETVSGTIQNRVVREDGTGTLDFYWRIMPTEGEGDIDAFRVIGFDNVTLDADWRIDGLGNVAPTTARYFGPGSGSVNFLFDGPKVGIGDSSNFFFLHTDATNYAMTGQFDLLCASSGCISPLYQTYAPAAVPLPAAAWLFSAGVTGLFGITRRKKVE